MEDTEYLLNIVRRTDQKGALPHPVEAFAKTSEMECRKSFRKILYPGSILSLPECHIK